MSSEQVVVGLAVVTAVLALWANRLGVPYPALARG